MATRTFSYTVQLLSMAARLHPAIYDLIFPHGPMVHGAADAVALNPQPLPPSPDPLLVGAARMASEVARIAVEADVRGESPVKWVDEFVEDWCLTPWPRRWPLPLPGPRSDRDQVTEPGLVGDARVIGAMVFASVGTRLAEGQLGDALVRGAERLAEAAVQPAEATVQSGG